MDYSILESKYSSDAVKTAVAIAKQAAAEYPESYYTGEDFKPHLWVVEAILQGFLE